MDVVGAISAECANPYSPHALSILSGVRRHVGLYQAIAVLPLVSKAFSRALRKPGPCWASLCLLPFKSMLSESPEDGARANFLVWLRPRASSVTEVHACIGNSEADNNSGFLIEQLCLALTNALVSLRVERDEDLDAGDDRLYSSLDCTVACAALLTRQEEMAPCPGGGAGLLWAPA